MKFIFLTRGLRTVVSDRDFPALVKRKWYALKAGDRFYAARDEKHDGIKKTLLMHRVLLNPAADMQVDHWDRDSLNNQRRNLRLATPTQNRGNSGKRKDGKCLFRGVCQELGKYRADVNSKGRHYFLGFFAAPEDAARAYDVQAQKIFGRFANLNFPISKNQTKQKKQNV